MKLLWILSLSDLRTTFRDPIFKAVLVMPFAAFAVIRWGWSAIQVQFPHFEPYAQVVLMWACLQSASMFGFIYGFLFLEEKEEKIWDVINILPVSKLKLVSSRLMAGVIISTCVNFCLIHYGQIVSLVIYKEVLLAFIYSLIAPLMALILGVFANNRIEGLAMVKIVNLLFIIPALIYFIPYKVLHIMALIPTYWLFKSMEMAENNQLFAVYLSLTLGIHLACIGILSRKFEKQINTA